MSKESKLLIPQPEPEMVAKRCRALQQAALEAVTGSEVKEIVEGLVKSAKQGDLKAAEFVLKNLVGIGAPAPPPQQPKVARPPAVVVIEGGRAHRRRRALPALEAAQRISTNGANSHASDAE